MSIGRTIGIAIAAAVSCLPVLPGAAGAAIPREGVYTWPSSVLLSVSTSPAGSGYITDSWVYTNCPGACIRPFDVGRVITLTAHPTNGFTFSGWSGAACAGQGNPCTFTITADTEVSANFTGQYIPPEPPPGSDDQEKLTVVNNVGLGLVVTSSPGGINCGGSCTHSFDGGTSVTLTVEETEADGFSCGFSDSGEHASPYTFTMTGARTVTVACIE